MGARQERALDAFLLARRLRRTGPAASRAILNGGRQHEDCAWECKDHGGTSADQEDTPSRVSTRVMRA